MSLIEQKLLFALNECNGDEQNDSPRRMSIGSSKHKELNDSKKKKFADYIRDHPKQKVEIDKIYRDMVQSLINAQKALRNEFEIFHTGSEELGN